MHTNFLAATTQEQLDRVQAVINTANNLKAGIADLAISLSAINSTSLSQKDKTAAIAALRTGSTLSPSVLVNLLDTAFTGLDT